MGELDNFDKKLIAELENDSRQTLSQIAKKLRSSQQVISYRIKSLEKRGIISEYYTIIDFSRLGYTSYRTMLRLSNLNEQKHKEIIGFLMGHLNALWIVDCGGRWDLIVNFIAKNIIQYAGILREFKSKFPEQIQNYDILTTVELVYFGRDYFTKNTRHDKFSSFGGEQKLANLDKTDLKILNLISENARINAVEIAEKLNVSPNTVILRIKELKKNGTIQGFKPLIHLEKTPYSSYKALIKFQNITEEKEKQIIKYLQTNISVVGIIKLIGLWDFEIEFEVETKEQMLSFTREFRDNFKDVIKEFEVIPLFHEYKYNFFPRDILN